MSRVLNSLQTGRMASCIDHVVARGVSPRETLFVCGFWRSGTTWLQQALARLLRAKTVYEPLHFRVPAVRALYAEQQLLRRSDHFLELYLPYSPVSGLADGSALRALFSGAIRSDLPGSEIRLLRQSWLEGVRRGVVLKCVRAQLCLRAIQSTFPVPVVYVYRDPRAVLASVRLTDWSWLFDELSLREQLLEPKDGRAGFFSKWSAEILEADRQGAEARVMTYWALTEKFVQHSYADGQAPIVFVSYEDLCLRREKLFREILERLCVGSNDTDTGVMTEDSFSTARERRGASIEARISGWKKTLSAAEASIIEETARHFGLEERLYEASQAGETAPRRWPALSDEST